MDLLSASLGATPSGEAPGNGYRFSGVRAVMISANRDHQIRDPGPAGARAGRWADSLQADGVIPAAPSRDRVSVLTLALNNYRSGLRRAGDARPGRCCRRGETGPCDRCLVSHSKGINTLSNILKFVAT